MLDLAFLRHDVVVDYVDVAPRGTREYVRRPVLYDRAAAYMPVNLRCIYIGGLVVGPGMHALYGHAQGKILSVNGRAGRGALSQDLLLQLCCAGEDL